MRKLKFMVEPFALGDVLWAFTVPKQEYHNQITVTKEDGGLVVIIIQNFWSNGANSDTIPKTTVAGDVKTLTDLAKDLERRGIINQPGPKFDGHK